MSVVTFTTAGSVCATTCATGSSVAGRTDPPESGAPVAGDDVDVCWPAWIVHALATRPRTTRATVALERIFMVRDASSCVAGPRQRRGDRLHAPATMRP